MFESSSRTLEHWQTDKRVVGTSFLYSSFEIANVLTRTHTVSYTPADDNLDGYFSANYLIIKASMHKTSDTLTFSLCRLKCFTERKHDQFGQLILDTESSNPTSGFREGDNALLHLRHSSITGLQLIFIPHRLRDILCTMAHHHKQAGYATVIRMDSNIQQNYSWLQMAADVTSAVQDCVKCAKIGNFQSKRSSLLKLIPALEPLELVKVEILGPLPKSRRGFHYIIMIADHVTSLVQVVPLRRICFANFDRAFLEHCVYKYGPPMTLLSIKENNFV